MDFCASGSGQNLIFFGAPTPGGGHKIGSERGTYLYYSRKGQGGGISPPLAHVWGGRKCPPPPPPPPRSQAVPRRQKEKGKAFSVSPAAFRHYYYTHSLSRRLSSRESTVCGEKKENLPIIIYGISRASAVKGKERRVLNLCSLSIWSRTNSVSRAEYLLGTYMLNACFQCTCENRTLKPGATVPQQTKLWFLPWRGLAWRRKRKEKKYSFSSRVTETDTLPDGSSSSPASFSIQSWVSKNQLVGVKDSAGLFTFKISTVSYFAMTSQNYVQSVVALSLHFKLALRFSPCKIVLQGNASK